MKKALHCYFQDCMAIQIFKKKKEAVESHHYLPPEETCHLKKEFKRQKIMKKATRNYSIIFPKNALQYQIFKKEAVENHHYLPPEETFKKTIEKTENCENGNQKLLSYLSQECITIHNYFFKKETVESHDCYVLKRLIFTTEVARQTNQVKQQQRKRCIFNNKNNFILKEI